ncbi:uncharacterized protein [Amphiura filiformis]|uniref:uncharacterized protein n=1 Tax=Amphiura filiformis TaxID=82378 RepID=UPI003B214DE2
MVLHISTPAPDEEEEDLPLAETLASSPLSPDDTQHSPEQSKQDSNKEKKTTTSKSEYESEKPVHATALTATKESTYRKSDEKETPKKKMVLHELMSKSMRFFHKKTITSTKFKETPAASLKNEGPKQAEEGGMEQLTPETIRKPVEQPDEIPENIRKANDQPDEIPENIRKAKKQQDDLEITFWDFAGQDLYYTTHQVFFNRRAAFALVFDMSKKLEEPCEVRDFSSEEEKSRFHDFNGEDFIKFWLQSIYTYATQDSADDKGYPPIFIIGTHKRDSTVEDEVVKREIFGILKGKKYEKYVRRQFHFLENDPAKKQPSDDEAFKATKEAVAKGALKAPHMKEKYPIKWLQFHKAVIEILGTGNNKPYMTLNETQELAAKCGITDESQFTTMLGLYHDLGTIIWFGEDKILKNTVILDPQWLIDVFKAVITVLPDEKQASQVTCLN